MENSEITPQTNKTIIFIDDPNNVNINTNFANGIAQYQDMNIYVDLSAERRGRTVIVKGSGGGVVTTENELHVNFLGYNDNVNNPDRFKFTTNYYDGSTASNEIQYESFGISSVKVSISSSFVPQVNIQFIDIRGLSFFNQENSPYRILFDFPPPIFRLRIKGYYGRALEYKLHLVKYTSEFKSENGNFVIDASFIAMTFAPLTDVLFRYATNAPFIGIEDVSVLTSKPSVHPVNTYDFILKLKNFYSTQSEKIKNSDTQKKLDDTIVSSGVVESAFAALNDYPNALKAGGTPIMFIANQSELVITNNPNSDEQIVNTAAIIYTINGVSDYNDTIKELHQQQDPATVTNRLYVGYVLNKTTGYGSMKAALDQYQKDLLLLKVQTVNDGDITSPKNILGTPPSTYGIQKNIEYIAIDITNYYIKTYREKTDAVARGNKLGEELNTMINDNITQNLGMTPTIYNVFKLILDDVDTFFRVLRKTSESAETEHNEPNNKRFIYNDIRDKNTKNEDQWIYAFPLVIEEHPVACGQVQNRVAPRKLSEKSPRPFPEIKLCYDFMNTFAMQVALENVNDIKGQANQDGVSKWIPISPIDSTLVSQNLNSPYVNLSFEPAKREAALSQILLNRFYILSEFAFGGMFYDTKDGISTALTDFYSKSEASNIALGVDNVDTINLYLSFASKYSGQLNKFYDFLKSNTSNYGSIVPNTFIPNGFSVQSNIDNIYINKSNEKYVGTTIYGQEIQEQILPEDPSNPLFKFMDTYKNSGFWSFLKSKLKYGAYQFTMQNTLLINDSELDNDGKPAYGSTIGGVSPKTRFLSNYYNDSYKNSNQTFLDKGNSAFIALTATPTELSNEFEDAIDVWSLTLSKNSNQSFIDVINTDSLLSSVLILSNFGHLLGPFNYYPHNLSYNVFQTPAAIKTPYCVAPYFGALIKAYNDGTFKEVEMFLTGSSNTDIPACMIFADYHDVNAYLSNHDKQIFLDAYDLFFNAPTSESNSYRTIKTAIVDMLNTNKGGSVDTYKKLLSSGNAYYNRILEQLLERTNLIVNSVNTFTYTYKTVNGSEVVYHPLTYYLASSASKKVLDAFFDGFFMSLTSVLTKLNDETTAKETEQKKLKGDDDILNQVYYSFKNINDKWLSNPSKTETGYPFNNDSENDGMIAGQALIDSFVFVDRAMNPVGDTVIDPEVVVDLFHDNNVSIFSVLSQILSLNHFEFFPLQNFMTHDFESWADTFKIDPTGSVKKRQAFVCMYIGGASSYPSNITGNGFEDDGIADITKTDAIDFNDCNKTDTNGGVTEINDNTGFKYKQVRAFRVKFGQQNQSMFSDIKIDSKSFPETNESIQILARLANDQANQAPTPKGQNLYNLYENRAYSATITGLGNAMIQPTQYFQLDNVPLFNGAYLILGVEHNITPNSMKTSFTGTKILRYPVPRVTNPATAMGFVGSSVGGGNMGTTNSIDPLKIVTPASTDTNPAPKLVFKTPPPIVQLNAPINPLVTTYTSKFSEKRYLDDGTKPRAHHGIDLAAAIGTPIWAANDGIVSTMKYNEGGYGWQISIDHNNGTWTQYGHLSAYAFDIGEAGTRKVKSGDVIGWVGVSGHHTGGGHLHFEYRIGANSPANAIDPHPHLEMSMKATKNWNGNPK
jgi:murein DD-endopeptidase MepM/ murein hydrolase activator NlpD